MAKSNVSPLVPFLSIVNGAVDVDATVENVRAAVVSYAEEFEARNTLVSEFLNEMFDQNMGKRFAHDAIVGTIVPKIQQRVPALSSPTDYSTVVDMIEEVLDAQVAAGTFNRAKGPGLGTGRTSECPVILPKTPKVPKAPKTA
jgi:hypothetical protein